MLFGEVLAPDARESCVSHLLLAPARESCLLAKFWRPARARVVCFTLTSGAGAGIMLFGEVLAPGAGASREFHTYFWRRRRNHAFCRSSGARRGRESCVSHLLLAPAPESCFLPKFWRPARARVVCFTLTSGAGAGIMLFAEVL